MPTSPHGSTTHNMAWEVPNVDINKAQVVLRLTGGAEGPPGPPTASIVIKGIANVYPPADATASKEGDLWIVPDPVPAGFPKWVQPGHGLFWDGHAWLDAGKLQGTKGDQGPVGPGLVIKGVALGWVPDSNPNNGDIWLIPDAGLAGLPTDIVPGQGAGWDATAGKWVPVNIVGPAGHSVEVFGPTQTGSMPPTVRSDGAPIAKGDIWLTEDPNVFSATFDPSKMTMIPGPPGPAGPVGLSAYEQWKVAVGRAGASLQDYLDAIKGAKGEPGLKGDPGETLKVEGVVATEADLPAAPPALTVNVTQDDGHLWVYDPTSAAAKASGWVDLGKISGPSGAAAHMTSPVNADADRPATGTPGEMIYVTSTGHIWSWNDVTQAWVDGGPVGAGGVDDGTAQGDILVWDDTIKHWAASSLKLSTITNVAATVQADGTDLEDNDILAYSLADTTWKPKNVKEFMESAVELKDIKDVTFGVALANGNVLTWDTDHWAAITPRVQSLSDVDVVTVAPTNGQALVWDATASKWKPGDVSGASPIVYLGTGTWDNTAALDGTAPLYGMPAGTTPSPTDYPPIPGDSYIDLATGHVTTFTGAAAATRRLPGSITGGGGALDIVRERLQDLDDVKNVTPGNNNLLMYDAAQSLWTPVPNSFATLSYVDNRVEALAIGLAHDVAVAEIRNNPPDGPSNVNIYYIVGTAPTGAWAGNANNIAHYTMGSGGSYDWHFESPRDAEAHLVEKEAATYTWSATRATWVKVAAAQTGANVNAASLYQVGDIKQSILNETQFRAMLGTAEADKWALADGRNVANSEYHTLTGNTNVPDLRGSFLRMAGQNATNVAWNGGALGAYQEDSTATPKTAFTLDDRGGHDHSVNTVRPNNLADGWGVDTARAMTGYKKAGGGWESYHTFQTGSNGVHTHRITGGGDSETRPRNYGVNFFIKVKA